MLKQYNRSLLEAIYEKYSELNDYVDYFASDSSSPNSSESSSSSNQSAQSSPTSPSSSSNGSSNTESNSPDSTSGSSTTANNEISFYIPSAYSPRKSKNENGNMKISISLVMSNLGINHIGNLNELASVCDNVLELDLSKNQIDDWEEVKKLLTTLKKLRLLNLSSNKLNIFNGSRMNGSDDDDDEVEEEEDDEEEEEKINDVEDDERIVEDENLNLNSTNDDYAVKQTIDYFNKEWHMPTCTLNKSSNFDNLSTLILNSCYLDLQIIECLLNRLKNLAELHLASNNYKHVTFDRNFRKHSLKILYFNNNLINAWSEVCKLGKCFPNLENLVISENNISNIDDAHLDQTTRSPAIFKNLNLLIINKLKINDWSSIDHLRKFPNLKHVRIQNIPLLDSLNDDEKYFVLVGHLDESIHSINGSQITLDDKENCERKYLRFFMDCENKPSRYYELESKHGKLDKLVDVSLEIRKKVNVKIKYNGKHMYDKIDVRQTVGDFKKYLEKYVGMPSSRFRVFYIDIEACSMAVYGPEELKHANRCLYSFNIRDHDEFEIDLKPVPQSAATLGQTSQNILHASHSENQLPYHHMHHLHYHHYNSHLNNNSQYQVPYFTFTQSNTGASSTTSTSSSTTTTRPILIKNNKKIFDNSSNRKSTVNSANNNSGSATSTGSTTTGSSASISGGPSNTRLRLANRKLKPGTGGLSSNSKTGTDVKMKNSSSGKDASTALCECTSAKSLPAKMNLYNDENKLTEKN